MIRSLQARAFNNSSQLEKVALAIFWCLAFAQAQDALSFSEALTLSQESPRVVLAQTQVANTQKQVAVAASLVSGSLTAGYSSSTGQLTAPSLAEPQSLDESGFDPIRIVANLNVIPYGPRYDSLLQAQARLSQAELDLQDSQSEALISAAEAFLTALRAAQDLELQKMALGLAQAELEANQKRFEVGAISASQLSQAELALQQAQLEVASAELARSGALLSLSNQLGVQVTAVTEAELELIPDASVELETQILQRSDVQKARLSLEQTKREAAATLRDNLPSGTVSLNYDYATDSQNLGLGASLSSSSFQPSLSASYDFDYEPSGATPEGASSSRFSFSLGLNIPLDASLPDALALADIAVQQAELSYQQTLESARLSIYNAQQQARSLEASFELNQDLLAQAEETLNISQQRFELGLVSQFDVQNAQLNLEQQVLRLAQAKDSLLLAQLSYRQSLGLNLMEVF